MIAQSVLPALRWRGLGWVCPLWTLHFPPVEQLDSGGLRRFIYLYESVMLQFVQYLRYIHLGDVVNIGANSVLYLLWVAT